MSKEKKAAKKEEKEKLAKMSKEEKKEYKKQKKAEKNTPEVLDFKQNILKAVTAVACVGILCYTLGGAFTSYTEALKLEKQAEAKQAQAYAAMQPAGGQQSGGSSSSGNSYVAPTDDGTAAPTDDGTAAPTDDGTAAPTDDGASTPTGGTTTPTGGSTTPAADSKGLNSTDAAAIAAFYNKAVKATKDTKPKGHQTMKLDGGITGDGALGAVLKVASPIIQSTLERNSTDTDYIPGHEADLLGSDIKKATAVSKDGVTTLTIQLKDQKDGPQADAHTAGPVARGIGTLGNVNDAVEELGAELYSGRETIVLNYNDAYIKCTIDENTGKITHGTWHYKVNVTIGSAEIKLGIKFTAKNLKACIDYSVVI